MNISTIFFLLVSFIYVAGFEPPHGAVHIESEDCSSIVAMLGSYWFKVFRISPLQGDCVKYLNYAIENNKLASIQCILENTWCKPHVFSDVENKNHPVYAAVTHQDPGMLKYLISKGVGTTKPNDNALSMAISTENPQIIKVLLQTYDMSSATVVEKICDKLFIQLSTNQETNKTAEIMQFVIQDLNCSLQHRMNNIYLLNKFTTYLVACEEPVKVLRNYFNFHKEENQTWICYGLFEAELRAGDSNPTRLDFLIRVLGCSVQIALEFSTVMGKIEAMKYAIVNGADAQLETSISTFWKKSSPWTLDGPIPSLLGLAFMSQNPEAVALLTNLSSPSSQIVYTPSHLYWALATGNFKFLDYLDMHYDNDMTNFNMTRFVKLYDRLLSYPPSSMIQVLYYLDKKHVSLNDEDLFQYLMKSDYGSDRFDIEAIKFISDRITCAKISLHRLEHFPREPRKLFVIHCISKKQYNPALYYLAKDVQLLDSCLFEINSTLWTRKVPLLHYLVFYNDTQGVHLFLEAVKGQKMSVNWYNIKFKTITVIDLWDKGGQTAIWYAAYQMNIDLIAVLLRAGADPDIRNYNGVSAVSLCESRNNIACLELFLLYQQRPVEL
jgi:hypothetical protein